jgi:hypothetical protein
MDSLFLYIIALHVSGAICTHPQEHKLQSTALGVCNGCCMLVHWSRYWLASPNWTMLKEWGCPSQYLLQWTNIPQPFHTHKAILCSLCSWGWVQIAPEMCKQKYRGIKNAYVCTYSWNFNRTYSIHYQDVRNHEHQRSNIVVGNLKPRVRKLVNYIFGNDSWYRTTHVVNKKSNVIKRNGRRKTLSWRGKTRLLV